MDNHVLVVYLATARVHQQRAYDEPIVREGKMWPRQKRLLVSSTPFFNEIIASVKL